ncbi:alpha/beta hydrolase [Paremcibacter congregatus]|uniref:alpha/beta fold hydrolase n=1 Tax=Paremcibacter congregatus TaxID=2043170 RepID=UPI0030EF6A53
MRFFSFGKFMVLFAVMGVASFSVAAASSAPEEGPAGEISYGQNAASGHYADINGIKFYYETYGDGAPLILIHGNGGSIASLAAQIAFFSRTYKVIVADSRGHGKSGLGDQPLTYRQMMEDWNVLLDLLNIQQAPIFGWSDGGILGLLLAINHPDKVAKLALWGRISGPMTRRFRGGSSRFWLRRSRMSKLKSPVKIRLGTGRFRSNCWLC